VRSTLNIIMFFIVLLSVAIITNMIMEPRPPVAHETSECMVKYKELEEKIQELDTKLKHFKYYQERYERRKYATKFASTKIKPPVRVLGF
jgi:short subunit fatty acids transporter